MTTPQVEPRQARKFLTAQWRQLAMLNYCVQPELLAPYVPPGTELDFFQGQTYVSIVGFMFQKTNVLGVPAVGYRNFEEVNLRFYVHRRDAGKLRRGVTFIKEISPKWLIEKAARWFYNENYVTLPMQHAFSGLEKNGRPSNGNSRPSVAYRWRLDGKWHGLEIVTAGRPAPPRDGSREQFIVEHYWGYGQTRDGNLLEYQVEHPPWNVDPAIVARYRCDVRKVYGEPFVDVLSRPPDFAFLADGSEVTVYRPTRFSKNTEGKRRGLWIFS